MRKNNRCNIIQTVIPRALCMWGLLLCLYIPVQAQGQNLVPNPSFEDFNSYTGAWAYSLDTSETAFPGILHWWSPTLWRFGMPIISDSIEQWNGHLNYVKPRTGQAHGLLSLGGNSYILSPGKTFHQAELITPLAESCYYRFGIHVFPRHIYKMIPSESVHHYAANTFGAYFSKERIRDTTGIGLTSGHDKKLKSFYHFLDQDIEPQVRIRDFITDTTGYTYVERVFKAEGGERYLTMGSFDSIENTTFKNLYSGQIISTFPEDTSVLIMPILFIDDLSLELVPPPDALLSVSRDTAICPRDSVRITASVTDGGSAFRWSTGDTTASIFVSEPGTYVVEALCPCGFSLWDTVVVGSLEQNPDLLIENQELCEGENFSMPLPEGFDYYLDNEALPGQLFIEDPGFYQLQAAGVCSTYSYDFRVEEEQCDLRLFIPNAFTPNDDGLNDCFEVVVNEVTGYEISVFSRWGQLVFHAKDLENCWDGTYKGAPVSGTFTYLVKACDRGGICHTERGVVNVVR